MSNETKLIERITANLATGKYPRRYLLQMTACWPGLRTAFTASQAPPSRN